MRRLILLLAVVRLSLLVPGAGAASFFDSPALHVVLEREPVNFAVPRYRAYVTAESNKFSFLLPEGYRLSGDPASGTLTMISHEGNRSITFTIAEAVTPDGQTQSQSPEVRRDNLLSALPTATVAQEFSRAVGRENAQFYDLQWKGKGDLAEFRRVAFVFSAAGVLNFTATSAKINAAALQADLDEVFSTFSYSTNGELKVHHISDRI